MSDALKPSSARIYDYYLGGQDNYAVDREAAETFLAILPNARNSARATRGFVLRATRAMAELGIRQFIDIGCGIPIAPNVHEIARQVHPDARIAYVDNDDIVIAKGMALRDEDGLTTVKGDLRDPVAIFTHPEVVKLIDFELPVAVLTVAVWHFLPGSAVYEHQATIREALPPGSCLALSHACAENVSLAQVQGGEALYQQTTNPLKARTRAEIADLFAGFELLDPGLVPLSEWRPRAGDPYPEPSAEALAGVGVVA